MQLTHLTMAQFQPIDLNRFVEPSRQAKIRDAIARVGALSLGTLRTHLGEEYSYDEIKLVRADWHREQSA
jgi:ATP-dependent DNA helicase RecQ